jgi:hypothetical protein
MMRDELLKQLSAVPENADVGIQLGDDHLDITDLVPWGGGEFVALRCHSADLRDVLLEWAAPSNAIEAPGRVNTQPAAPE